MASRSGGIQTIPHAHSPRGDNTHLGERKMTSQLTCTSWMANVVAQHLKPGWFQMESGCVFLLVPAPEQIS